MALEVFFQPPPTGDALAAAVSQVPYWSVTRSGLRRRPSVATFDNPETGVAFTIGEESDVWGFGARLNVARPDFYGREAVAELVTVAAALGSGLLLEGEPASSDSVLAGWRSLNATAWTVIQPDGDHALIDREQADGWWAWQHGLDARRKELAEVAWLPRVLLFRDAETGRAVLMSTWAEGQAEAIPPVDVALYLTSVDGQSALTAIPQPEARSAVQDLLQQVTSGDGLVIDYIPIDQDAVARERGARLAATHQPFDSDRYVPIAIHQLRHP